MRERLLLSIAARLCTAFFCVSRAVEESWFGDSAFFGVDDANRGRRHFTIYNGVEENSRGEQFATGLPTKLKADLGLLKERIIGVVARLRTEKGHALLFDAMQRVREVVPDAALLVVGDGPDRSSLIRHARVLELDANIVWAGEQSAEAVRDLYCVMDVVAVPSQSEGFGLSAAEAMAAGRPVVGTRVGGLAEIIEDGVTGYLVAPGDKEELAAAIIRVLGDPQKSAEMGTLGRKRVAQNFSSKRFAESIIGSYRYFTEKN